MKLDFKLFSNAPVKRGLVLALFLTRTHLKRAGFPNRERSLVLSRSQLNTSCLTHYCTAHTKAYLYSKQMCPKVKKDKFITEGQRGCQIWTKSRSDWHKLRQIWNFFISDLSTFCRSDFCTFWLVKPKCNEI